MSANNVVWVMKYKGFFHVFYSGCMDNTPKEPDYEDKYYAEFKTRTQALNYANTVVWAINDEAYKEGHVGVEYGVCIVPREFMKPKKETQRIFHIDKIIEEWKQKIKDLQFSIEQFEDWKKELKASEPSSCCKNCIRRGHTLDYCHLYSMKCPYDKRNIVKGPVQIKDEFRLP